MGALVRLGPEGTGWGVGREGWSQGVRKASLQLFSGAQSLAPRSQFLRETFLDLQPGSPAPVFLLCHSAMLVTAS